MEYHVAITGNDNSKGGEKEPLRTISKAAQLAKAGDTVIVHEGTYREWVRPQRGGRSDSERIVYRAATGEKVIIKGSEKVQRWKRWKDKVWKAEVANCLFGEYNPFQEVLWGDWLIYPKENCVHAGEVYLNGKAMYEAAGIEEVEHPTIRCEGMNPPWTKCPEAIPHPEDTLYQWYAQVEEKSTVIYANFQEYDPNQELIEINVRKCCFYPERMGINYITIRGFEMAQAACPWAPPTAEQLGLLGVHWGKGWIIEENLIHDAKCSAISIGKGESAEDNECTSFRRKSGYQYQMEAVFKSIHNGWDKESVGGHIIRNNRIYDCGQNAIVGHLGSIFSRIYGNDIYNIGVKHEFFGYEISGIKLHAAIDVQIENNYIHDCTLGTWLDWEAQGARISRNVYANNNRDLMIEVTHGPYIVDNNIFASAYNLDNIAQGGAYINNLFCGTMRRESVLDRSTPYHVPHSTIPLGTAFVYGGDDRWYQNIFVGGQTIYSKQSIAGTKGYNGSPTSMEEFRKLVDGQGDGDHESFQSVRQPVYIKENCYFNGAESFEQEENGLTCTDNLKINVEKDGDGVYLFWDVPKALVEKKEKIISTELLGMPRIVEERYEEPSGKDIIFDYDICGDKRNSISRPGPIADVKAGEQRIKVYTVRC